MDDRYQELMICLIIVGVITAIPTPMSKALFGLSGAVSVGVGLASAVVVLGILAFLLRRRQ